MLRELRRILESTRDDIFEYDENGYSNVCKDCQDDARNDALKEIQYKNRLEPLDFYIMGFMDATERAVAPLKENEMLSDEALKLLLESDVDAGDAKVDG